MDLLHTFADWLYQSSGSPFAHLSGKVQLVALGLIGALLAYGVLIFRPAPALGEPNGPQVDQDGRGGTPHWSVRTVADRSQRLALPLAKSILLVLAALTWGIVALAHPAVAGTSFPAQTAFVGFAVVIGWVVAARFWAMGRKARLTVVDSDDGTVGLNYWWVSELGLQESARLRLGGILGQGEAGVFWLSPGQKRNEIALPPALKARLRVKDGDERNFTLASTEGGAGPWPLLLALPLAYGAMQPHGQVLATGAIEPVAATCEPRIIQTEKIVEKPVTQIVEREICTVYFDFDKSSLNGNAKRALATVDGKAREQGALIGVVGHTDTKGTVPYNQTLSQERAESAAKSLEAHGISVSKIEGRGESDLAVMTPDETREARNRRTVITVDPPELARQIPTQ